MIFKEAFTATLRFFLQIIFNLELKDENSYNAKAMNIKEIYTGKLFVKTYCFRLDEDSIAIVDPGGTDYELMEYLKREKAKKLSIMITHGHFDHVGGLAGLLKVYPESRIYIHKSDSAYLGSSGVAEHIKCFAPIHAERYIKQFEAEYGSFPEATDIISDGDIVNGFKVIHTPGHTPGSVCYYSAENAVLFSGDTLFYHSYGRTDLYGGSDAEMAKSLKRILQLPGQTKVYPGHSSNTTIAAERIALAHFL